MNIAVTGIQWGDEGKGKIVDWLAGASDVVVRFQGGNNAGHTLVVGGTVYKLSLVPSGILHPGKLNVIGGGTVLDPRAFLDEIESLSKQGIEVSPNNLAIAANVPLLLPVHRELDRLREESAGRGKIGTTLRGIGPAYEDKIGRRAIRLGDLGDSDGLLQRVENLLRHHNALRRGMGAAGLDSGRICDELLGIAPRLITFASPTWKLLRERQAKGERLLFEGAQGALLDVDHGTYPFVTSSSTVAGGVAAGAGISPRGIGHILGVCKAYITRVGAGPFPTELFDDNGRHLAARGHEKGTVTGRSRRCGWFDAVLVRQMCSIAGIDSLALTKLDVLDGMREIRICTGYELDGTRIDHMPAGSAEQERLQPVWETCPGWDGQTAGCRDAGELPAGAVKYIRRIEELAGVKVDVLSTSPKREDTVVFSDRFFNR